MLNESIHYLAVERNFICNFIPVDTMSCSFKSIDHLQQRQIYSVHYQIALK